MRKPKKKKEIPRSPAGASPTHLYLSSIRITDDDDFHPYGFEVTDAMAEAVNTYRALIDENPEKAAKELPSVIKRYPEVPYFRNHLFVALKRMGRTEEAYAVNDQAIRDHPDYIFARMNKAIQHWEKEEYEEAEGVLGGRPVSIERAFPGREVFHIREVYAFYSFLLRLTVSKGRPDAAEHYYKLLSELTPDHPELPELRKLINMHILKDKFSEMLDHFNKLEERRRKRKK